MLEEMEDLDKNKNHDFYLIIDRLVIKEGIRSRLYDALELAARLASGKAKVLVDDDSMISFSQTYSCEDSNFTIPELEPRLFSFNVPIGACPSCNGLGYRLEITEDLIMDPEKAILDGGLIPYKK